MNTYEMQFIVFGIGLPVVMIVVVTLLFWLSVMKSRLLKKSMGTEQEFNARRNMRNTGLVIMAFPWAIILVLIVLSILSSQTIGGTLLILSIPFLATFLVTLSRPLLGGSLAIGAFILLGIPAVGLIAIHYEMSSWYGSIILLFDLIWLTGALTVLRSLPRKPKYLSPIGGSEISK